MKNVGGMSRVAVCSLIAVMGSTAGAAAPSARPAEVFAEVVIAAPASEQPRWVALLSGFGSKGSVPPVEGILNGLARTLGVNSLDGLDPKRPAALVLLDPRRFPKPVLLVAEIASDKVFATALAAAPELASKRQKRAAVIGAAEAIAAAGDYALSRLRGAPADGLRGRIFREPVWAAYGGQAQMLRALLMAQGSTPDRPMPAATLGKVFDGVIAGIEQSTELDLDVGARNGGVDVILSLALLPGTTIDRFAAQQAPGDFSLLGKFADQSVMFLAGGRLNFVGLSDGFAELMFGDAARDPKLSAQIADWTRLWSGELGMAGWMTAVSKIEYQYLLRAADPARFAATFPKMIDAMTQNPVFEGMAKITRTAKPNASYDGLTLYQSEMHYDMSKLQTNVGDKKFTLKSAWTTWDDLVAMTTGVDATERMRQLIDAARHGKGAWQPNAAIRAAIDRARAAKESLWLRMDLGAMAALANKGTPIPPGIAPTISLGAAAHTLWLRVSVPSPPQTAGSL